MSHNGAPVNVRVVKADGRVIPVRVEFVKTHEPPPGPLEGRKAPDPVHEFATFLPLGETFDPLEDQLACDTLPAHTAMTFMVGEIEAVRPSWLKRAIRWWVHEVRNPTPADDDTGNAW